MFFFIYIFFFIKAEASDFNLKYHNYDELSDILKHYSEAYPHKSHLYSIGKTVENRDIWVMAISNFNPHEHVLLRPELKLIGNIHGNEIPTQEILISLVHHLLENPNNDKNIEFLLDNSRVHILASLNPDGVEKVVTKYCDGSKIGRNNSNNYDLNRNFDDMYFCNKEPIQPETKSIIDWLENNTFVLSANFHTGAVVASYGFDNFPNSETATLPQKNPTNDEKVLKHLAYTYSKNNYLMLNNSCNDETFVNGITNGAEWFPPVRGGMQDFNYWKFGCMEITLEIYCCLNPPENELKNIWEQNKNSLIEFLKEANIGVKGVIQYENGQPAKWISIQIDSREPEFKTNENGEYFKLLLPGVYNMSLKLSCDEFYHVKIKIPAQTKLLVFNITLKNEIYEHSLHYELNKYPEFCTKAHYPVDCNDRHIDSSIINFTNKIKSQLLNNMFMYFILIILQSI